MVDVTPVFAGNTEHKYDTQTDKVVDKFLIIQVVIEIVYFLWSFNFLIIINLLFDLIRLRILLRIHVRRLSISNISCSRLGSSSNSISLIILRLCLILFGAFIFVK